MYRLQLLEIIIILYIITGKPAEIAFYNGGGTKAQGLNDGDYTNMVHTGSGTNPWWRVDMQNVYCVIAMSVMNHYTGERKIETFKVWFVVNSTV